MGPRNLIVLLIVLIVLFSVFDRGARLPYAYGGGGVATLIVVLIVLWVLGWL